MADPKPVVPTLHNISTPILTNLGDQVAYVIRWFFANPGGTSSNNEDELISFRKLNSQYGKNPDDLCEHIASQLEEICKRYSLNLKVECTYKMEDHFGTEEDEYDPESGQALLQGTYYIEISVTDLNGEPIIPRRTIMVDKKGETIDVSFKHRS